MKKIIAVAIATIMVLSCSMFSFAWDKKEPIPAPTDRVYVNIDKADYTVDGDVTTGGIESSAYDATVIVDGNVSNTNPFLIVDAVKVSERVIVKIEKNVSSEVGNGVNIKDNAQVTVGGNVTARADGMLAINAKDESIVIVEGTVNGNVNAGGQVYIGQLNGDIDDSTIDKVHYLIGTLTGGDVQLTDIVFGGDIGNDTGNDTVTGVDKGSGAKSYRYTNTADTSTDLTITLKSNVEGKQLKNDIGTLPAGVTPNYDNGVWTLSLDSNFKGGLQELQLLLEDIAHDNPDVPINVVVSHSSGSTKPLYTGTWANPVTNGNWHYDEATDKWSYSTTYKFTDTWGCIANPYADNEKGWFYFDKNGNMLTGWHWLNWNGVKRCYYLNPSKDTRRGKCQLGGVTPDGYTVDETGAWTVNGVVQEQK